MSLVLCAYEDSSGYGITVFMKISAAGCPGKGLACLIKRELQRQKINPASSEKQWMGICHLPSEKSDANCSFRCESLPSDTWLLSDVPATLVILLPKQSGAWCLQQKTRAIYSLILQMLLWRPR